MTHQIFSIELDWNDAGKVIENECTNYVQSWLEKGWRIVAVCPPNDCRRPTFILGHADQNPERP